jgi:excisionase family DNA binding protein
MGSHAAYEWLTAEQVAQLLQVKRRTVYSLVDQGVLPARRIGNRLIRFRSDEVEKAIEESPARQ